MKNLLFTSLVQIITAILFIIIVPIHAHSFDCTKASTPTEEAICSRANLKSQDDAMSRIYFELRNSMLGPAKKQLLAAQKNWLKYRADYCGGDSDCLLDETQNWTETFTGLEIGMVPLFIWQKGGEGKYRIRVNMVKFASPATSAQKLLNDEIASQLKEIPIDEVVSEKIAYTPEHELSLEIHRSNEKILSANFNTANYSGAHPSFWQDAININLTTGKRLQTAQLFSQTSIVELTNQCRDQIVKVKYEADESSLEESRKLIEEEYPNEVRKHILDMTTWTFADKGVTIWFDKYDIGPGVEPPYECEFAQQRIISLAKEPGLFEN